MANTVLELTHDNNSDTLYGLLFNLQGQVWDNVGAAMATYVIANLGNYDVPLTNLVASSQRFKLTMPAGLPADGYRVSIFKQAGGAPAEADGPPIAEGWIDWNGTDIVEHKANKAAIQAELEEDGASILDTLRDRLTAARAGYLDNLLGHTAQTGDVFAQLPANFADLAISPTTGQVTVGTLAAGVITAAAIASNAIDADAAAADLGSELAAALLDLTDGVESGYTLRQSLRIMLSALAGKVSGADANAPVFRDVGDLKNRISATTDVNGNRSVVTLDGT